MAQSIQVKICGLRTSADVSAVASTSASYVGFVFYPKSPRNVSFQEAATLAFDVPVGVAKVALVVNANDAFLDLLTAAVPLDILQLHGSESPARVAEVKARYGLPVMKAIGIADASDLAQIDAFACVADQLLIDAKPPQDAKLPGGNGLAFDWTLLAGRKYWTVPWMLAGGLTPENVSEAVRLTGATQVDVSSGVEGDAGLKDSNLIASFVAAAQL